MRGWRPGVIIGDSHGSFHCLCDYVFGSIAAGYVCQTVALVNARIYNLTYYIHISVKNASNEYRKER
jgi:hypothetical protein